MVDFYRIKVKNDSDILNEDDIGLVPYLNNNIKFQVRKYETQRGEQLKLVYVTGAFFMFLYCLLDYFIVFSIKILVEFLSENLIAIKEVTTHNNFKNNNYQYIV